MATPTQPDSTAPTDAAASSPTPEAHLKKSLGAWQVGLYGLGSMLGAGIYALIGKAVGILGNAVWVAFLAALVAAILTGLSYACVGSRYARAGGAAYVTQRALGKPWLSYVIGLSVTMSGLTSMAAGVQAIVLNLGEMNGQDWSARTVQFFAIGLVAVIGLLLSRGIRESMWANILCTVVEAAGLLFIIAIGLRFWGSVNYLETPTDHNSLAGSGLGLAMVLQGVVLTFYSFIGFEDILNVSEEVKEPKRQIPLGLLGAMAAATLIYLAVSITAVSVVPWRELAASPTPLMEVARRAAPWFAGIPLPGGGRLFSIGQVYGIITIFAIANTALLNYLMGSRLLYGMSRQRLMPKILGWVHPRRQTPQIAIGLLFLVVSMLILSGGVKPLAEATVLLLLFTFTAVNVSLFVLLRRPGEPRGGFEVPAFVPALGALICLILLGFRFHAAAIASEPEVRTAPLIALAVVALALVLYAILRPPSGVAEEG